MLNMWGGLQAADPLYFQNEPLAFAVYDTAGTDTLNFSTFTMAQEILLTALQYSDIGRLVNNVVIARGVVIENAISGAGNYCIIGNDAANILRGNGGHNTGQRHRPG